MTGQRPDGLSVTGDKAAQTTDTASGIPGKMRQANREQADAHAHAHTRSTARASSLLAVVRLLSVG